MTSLSHSFRIDHFLSATLTAVAFALLALSGASLKAEPPELLPLKQQYEKLTFERVQTAYDAGLKTLNDRYLEAIDRTMASSRSKGDLEAVLALGGEKSLVLDKKPLPEIDGDTKPAVATLRKVYHEQLKTLEQQRDTNLKTILTPYLERLKALETSLTKADRVDQAKEVMVYRSGLASADVAVVPQTINGGEVINSLGMKFIPVKGTTVHFCIHETRRQDYAAFAADVSDVNAAWKTFSVERTAAGHEDDHPVVHVSWEDAVRFCEWLSKKEGKKYRLPTDKEWSYAVGCGNSEKWTKSATPESLNNKVAEYPWGKKYLPASAVRFGNVGDRSYISKYPNNPFLETYDDGFVSTAPVMKFDPNENGLYDMCGNVWEWVADYWNESKAEHVLRGGGWTSSSSTSLMSSHRIKMGEEAVQYYRSYGFRVVLEGP
ncbi:formylglycine-generating enzyme family protein [Brevifollis gellanilyticus]|uniref:Sulfatase-modifying factor enzyme-like domain-containing protein n=1 Tax=Brevifollis gellanilyticus TaxID=748831 RepID=A0A512M8P3_9BACT|nr:SUMF1/EgtB/PvdO family nonheme iron enzyme [Brevifollis gellanilyticus]GEP43097.1 hypothetical protein BGE01nite_23880 [Brevifollis gellanilyticus]